MTDTKKELTQELLKEFLHYDPDAGVFTWKERVVTKKGSGSNLFNSRFAGKDAGNKSIRIFEGRYSCKILAWLYVYGEFPKIRIYHINGVKTDNRIENLIEDKINKNIIETKKEELTHEMLKNILNYDELTGVFIWRVRDVKFFTSLHQYNSWNASHANKEAGSISKTHGMIFKSIRIFNKNYPGHRLAYFYMTGKWPKEDIDCIDGDYTNLKFKNIRQATRSDTRYKRSEPHGKNKLIGCHYCNTKKKYVSQTTKNGKRIFLGYFNTPEEAHQAYVNAKRQISPEFSML